MSQSYSKSGVRVLACVTTFVTMMVVSCTPRPAAVKKENSPGVSQFSGPREVSGTITRTSSYCGGARPTEEVLEEYNKPKPYSGKTLFVIEGQVVGHQNKVVSKLVSNDSGFFKLTLQPGTYALLQEEQLKPLDVSVFNAVKMVEADTSCLRRWWKEPLAVFHVEDKEVKGININFHHKCFVTGDIPCLSYVGPMPP